jgi:hypothetical protein
MAGWGVSGVWVGESLGRVDSSKVGIISVVFGVSVELGGVVAVIKLQAMDAERIDTNEIILAIFIFPPEKLCIHCISSQSKRKPSSRAGRGCRDPVKPNLSVGWIKLFLRAVWRR